MRSILSSVLLMASSVFAQPTVAGEQEFFQNVKGKWSGPGEIVAGKYKGTKFICTFDGSTPKAVQGMKIKGSCRVGIFPQEMSAEITKSAGNYAGKFLDGQGGDGMDVKGGRYTRDRLVVDIKRKDLNGILVANLRDPNRLRISVSVNHKGKLVPVIGMNLARQPDSTLTGSVKQ